MAYSLRARLAVVVLLAVATVSFAACATSINKVLADPSRYRNEEVKVTGTVIDSYSIGTRGAYRLADGPAEIQFQESRQEIASRLSMKPETLSRILRQLSDAGAIEVHGRVLQVPDRNRLLAMLDSVP